MNHRCGEGDELPAGIRGRISDFWMLADSASELILAASVWT